ncbi:hypothetical protein C943_03228 [Mariniradius saccharolyticus AK6]|uniref:Uncharacterized protein n=1 Tax=Mariniradius saccharolyticus AK6 TaxID=1239962 RepID=M7YCM6_9BACT|nr:hypothetical protein C943_03228 [Mariniradius saccharolyticus AK6]
MRSRDRERKIKQLELDSNGSGYKSPYFKEFVAAEFQFASFKKECS